MIAETTLKALQALFPESLPSDMTTDVSEVTAENAQDDQKSTEAEAARPNGVLQRDYAIHGYHIDAQVAPDQLLTAVEILDQAEFFIETITGVDWIKENQFEVIYDFSRYDFDVCRVVIRTRISRDEPVVPTITGIYAGANWHERETHDFFGIKFDGHPHLIPLLLPEDADFHPLRKDFKA